MPLVPLPLAIPLIVAAAIMATSRVLPRRLADAAATATAAATTGLSLGLLARAMRSPLVYWFGGWTPHHGIALGIAFTVDALGAGMAALVGLVVTVAFVFSWRYFNTVGYLYHVLMLVFLAAMTGLSLTGDLFDLFVFYELMSVAAFALTGYQIEESGPLQGALNFAVVESVGAYLVLSGIGLIYGRTGALNLAQIGNVLAGHRPDGLVVIAFVFMTCGFLVKAGAVPFHFWMSDAYAVAPSPVCVVFAGVMDTLGLFALVRVYWTVFSGTLGGHAVTLQFMLVGIGLVTALVGGIMCFLQHHLKRLLAFSTVSHVGFYVAGVGYLNPLGLAASATYAIAHGLIKAALFMATGLLLNRYGRQSERDLRGCGRGMPVVGAIVVLGGLGLAGMPPFATYLGKDLIDASANDPSRPLVALILIVASVLTGGAVLRAAGAVFLGWGPASEDASSRTSEREERPETEQRLLRAPVVMLVPAFACLAIALALGVVPGLSERVEQAAYQFENRAAYGAVVLGAAHGQPHLPTMPVTGPAPLGLILGFMSALLAVALALYALFRHRLPRPFGRGTWSVVQPTIRVLRAAHSGHVGDYVTWLVVGVAIVGAALGLSIR